jgi:5-deoxy-glucuronate isomerase
MATETQTALDSRIVFRKTNAQVGRNISVTPANSTNRHLSYGRIILNPSLNSILFSTGVEETGLIILSGAARLDIDGQTLDMTQYDSVYVPRGSDVRVSTERQVDIAEFSAPVAGQYPLQVVRYADVCKDASLRFTAGKPTQQRQLSILIGKNINAGRLLAGFTVSDPGNWTSWPPHEHAALLEEMYVYFDMPEPAFGIQLVYNDTQYPELVTPVRDGDAVLMPGGYHPNVSIPGHRICFLWAMAAHREQEDRQFGVVNVQPGFGQGGSGLEQSGK